VAFEVENELFNWQGQERQKQTPCISGIKLLLGIFATLADKSDSLDIFLSDFSSCTGNDEKFLRK